MKPYIKILSIILLLGLFFYINGNSQEDKKPPTRQEMIQASLQDKLTKQRIRKKEKCREDAYARAAEMVDSTLLARAQAERVDTTKRPPKPVKPSKPTTLTAKDTSAVKPLIE